MIPSSSSDATPAWTSVDVDPHRLKGEGKLVRGRDLEVAEEDLGQSIVLPSVDEDLSVHLPEFP